MSETDELARLERELEQVRAKRGYLLPHHGLMALTSPKLLAGYDAAYSAMALDDRILSHHDREFVWLAVLAAVDESLATHHIAKLREAGGTDDTIAASFAACAWALGGQAHDFAARDWARQLAPWDPASRLHRRRPAARALAPGASGAVRGPCVPSAMAVAPMATHRRLRRRRSGRRDCRSTEPGDVSRQCPALRRCVRRMAAVDRRWTGTGLASLSGLGAVVRTGWA